MTGTIWTDIDEGKTYKNLDLAEVDRLFSAYQKNGTLSIEGSIEDLRSMGTLGRRTRVISVIDSRRYIILYVVIVVRSNLRNGSLECNGYMVRNLRLLPHS